MNSPVKHCISFNSAASSPSAPALRAASITPRSVSVLASAWAVPSSAGAVAVVMDTPSESILTSESETRVEASGGVDEPIM